MALYAIVSASCCTVLTFTDGTTALQLGPADSAGRYVVAASGKRENENRDPDLVFPLSSRGHQSLSNSGRNSRVPRNKNVGFGVTIGVSPTKAGTRSLNGARDGGRGGGPATTSLPKSPFRFATAPQNIKRSGGRRGGSNGRSTSVGTGSDVAAAVAASHAYRGRISNDWGHTKGARGRNAIFVGRGGIPSGGKLWKAENTKTAYGKDTINGKSKIKNKGKTLVNKITRGHKDISEDVWHSASASSSIELIGNARNDHEALLSSSAASSLSSSGQGPRSLIAAQKTDDGFASYKNTSKDSDTRNNIEYYGSDEENEESNDDDEEMYDIEDYEGEKDLSLTDDQEMIPTYEKYESSSSLGKNVKENFRGSNNNFVSESQRLQSSKSNGADGQNASGVWTSNNWHNLTESSENVIARRPLHIQRIRQNATKKLPQAIIIGVKKCGTRALLEYLRLHPDMKGTGPEPHFFDRHYHKGLEWYRNKMPPTIDGQMTIEKTPSYFITKEVPKRIFNMSKNMKILVIVRDPITRAISDYAQLASKRIHMQRFEDLAFVNTTTRIVDTTWNVIRIGVYAKFLERWLHYFPLSQIHFVSGEELISDPARELSRVQDFLGLKRIISEKHFYFNETKGFPCLKKTEGSGHPHCLGKTKGRPHPTVDPTVLKRLRDFYRPFNAKFYHMVQRNFNWP